jgi:hypothetical protein
LQAKALHYNAIAQHRKANELLQQSKFGEQVARLKIAVDLLKKAMDLQKSLPDSMVSELKVCVILFVGFT